MLRKKSFLFLKWKRQQQSIFLTFKTFQNEDCNLFYHRRSPSFNCRPSPSTIWLWMHWLYLLQFSRCNCKYLKSEPSYEFGVCWLLMYVCNKINQFWYQNSTFHLVSEPSYELTAEKTNFQFRKKNRPLFFLKLIKISICIYLAFPLSRFLETNRYWVFLLHYWQGRWKFW